MAIMFMKIDTNCDGTVDWVSKTVAGRYVSRSHGNKIKTNIQYISYLQDEFCTYMLLEYQEKDVMAGEKLAPFPYPLRVLHR